MINIKTVFLGSDWESLETLKALDEDDRFEIVGVITPTDKPVGRKHEILPSKVKAYALEHGIPFFHTERNDEKYREALELFKPELVVCKAFGEIIPEFFLEYPKYKSINVHFSILPEYRGAIPIQKAILDGKKKTGVSIMLMSAGLDEGDILEIFEEEILGTDTNQTLRERLVSKSANILGNVLEKWINGEITPIPQDKEKATYCWQKEISKENAQIDWENMDVEYIERMVRALLPWPVAWTVLDMNEDMKLKDKRLKIFKAKVVDTNTSYRPGYLFDLEGRLFLHSRDGKALELFEFQLEGKAKTSVKEFLNGFKNIS